MEEYNFRPPVRKNKESTPYVKSLILIIMTTQDKFYYSLVVIAAIITIMVIIMMFIGPNLVLASCVGIGTLIGLASAITYCAIYSRKN